jgi:SAM-dependent methyltransferase
MTPDDSGKDRRFHGNAARLRDPQRIARLEIPRVVEFCLEGADLGSMLDIGTGTGLFAQAFAEKGIPATGLDANPELLALAREHVPSGTFVAGDAEKLPFTDRSFDLVFLGHLLHESEDPLAVLKEARRVAIRRVVIVEWPYRLELQGPPLAQRMKAEKVAELSTLAGFMRFESFELEHITLFRLDL